MGLKLNFFLVILALFLVHSESKSLNECPDDSQAHILLGSQFVDLPKKEHTSLVRRIRMPEEGLYDYTINCIMATDFAVEDDGGDVEITAGGLNHRYVELRMNSKIGAPLDYLVSAWATDIETENDGSDIGITAGGLNHQYVELSMSSKIGKPLDYGVLAWAN